MPDDPTEPEEIPEAPPDAYGPLGMAYETPWGLYLLLVLIPVGIVCLPPALGLPPVLGP